MKAVRNGTILLIPALALLASSAPVGPATADIIELVSGRRVQGTVKRATVSDIVVDVDGREVTFAQELVVSVTFEPRASAVAPPERPAAPPPARPEAPAPPPEPVAAPIERSEELTRALAALKDLRSSTGAEGAGRHRDRVAAAREPVAAYLVSPNHEPPAVKEAVAAAFRYYVLATIATDLRPTEEDIGALGRSPLIATCPHAQRLIEETGRTLGFDPTHPRFAGLVVATEGRAALWTCAAENLERAEALASGRQ
jgi:hypothetical protein